MRNESVGVVTQRRLATPQSGLTGYRRQPRILDAPGQCCVSLGEFGKMNFVEDVGANRFRLKYFRFIKC